MPSCSANRLSRRVMKARANRLMGKPSSRSRLAGGRERRQWFALTTTHRAEKMWKVPHRRGRHGMGADAQDGGSVPKAQRRRERHEAIFDGYVFVRVVPATRPRRTVEGARRGRYRCRFGCASSHTRQGDGGADRPRRRGLVDVRR